MNDPARSEMIPTFPTSATVVNIGLSLFADAVAAQGHPVAVVDWRIPAGGDAGLVATLNRLYGRRASLIDRANAEVVRRLDEGNPRLVDVAPAGSVVPGLGPSTLLHCGPRIDYSDACDPLQRSMRAAVVAEGWATTIDEADRALRQGDIHLDAANEHDTVVPMVTALGPSQPVWVAENASGNNHAFAPLNQGPGETPWFGRETPAAVDRLRLLSAAAGPVLAAVLRDHGPIDVLGLAAQGVQMGDDVHIRVQASTNLLLRTLLPHLIASDHPARVEVGHFLSANHLFFLTAAMAAARSLTGWAAEVPHASIVTTMSRNGSAFGVKLAGSDEWHLAEAPPIGRALYYAGHGAESSARDVGDSAVLELIGLGGPAAAGSPSVAAFVGGSMADAAAMTAELDLICHARSTRFKLPTLDGRGTPLGVDVRKVVELGITPSITTGILHASAGTGQVGAGVATAPIESFQHALVALDRALA
ncbi:MAG TPA: DUF1116 domain-containing protein [Acidimicrobiales bacterium]|nr:DUF1116 domain-containing protein [Acidimicrobiales bacterium]